METNYQKHKWDLTTVALPSLIANDLVIVYPLKSRTGYIQYLQFTAGSNKGGVKPGDVFNDVFRLGEMTDSRINYTSSAVVEPVEAAGEVTLAWTPSAEHGCSICKDGKVIAQVRFIPADGSDEVKLDVVDGKVTVPGAGKIAYTYDNVIIPQNDIPQLTAHMQGIELAAKARRIGIYYSQMAAFQAKTEMGIDLGEVLATQACAELSYEIDTEIVKLLSDNAKFYEDLEWSKTLPVGVSKRDHYAGFAEVVELASQHIYDATRKHAANYMLVASNIKPILVMMDGFKAASSTKINGPYFAGDLNGVKVYVSPALEAGRFVLGYNGGDMVTSAAVYAPYMAIVPTQCLGFADGAMSQGFSTMYDLRMLNPSLLVAGKVVESSVTADATHAVING